MGREIYGNDLLQYVWKRPCGWDAQKPCAIRAEVSIDFTSLMRSFFTCSKRLLFEQPYYRKFTGTCGCNPIMARAGIAGPQASPKGLRHGFGVACIEKGIPLNLVQRWLGHAQLSTTAIYADVVGEEERHIAARLWT